MTQTHALPDAIIPNWTYPTFSNIRKPKVITLTVSCNHHSSASVNGDGFKWSPCKGLKCRGQTEVAVCVLHYFLSEFMPLYIQVCQHADQYYNCGNYTRPIFMLDSYSPFRFRIEYPGGEQWRYLHIMDCVFTLDQYLIIIYRISVFEFMEETVHSPTTMTFLSENPPLQYVSQHNYTGMLFIYFSKHSLQNFLVAGKCVGQPSCTSGSQ